MIDRLITSVKLEWLFPALSLPWLIKLTPIPLPLVQPESTVVTHVACGRAHTVVATNNEGRKYK